MRAIHSICFLILALAPACDSPRSADDLASPDAAATLDASDDAAVATSDLAQPAADFARPGGDLANYRDYCPQPGEIAWQAHADDDGKGNVQLYLRAYRFGNVVALFRLYQGPLSALSSLPYTRSVSCTSGGPPCEQNTYIISWHEFSILSGTITINYVTSPLSSEVKVTLSDIVYNERACVPNSSSGCTETLLAGHACPAIVEKIDTVIAIGSACGDVSDCGTNGKACDIAKSSCQPSECTSDDACAGGACVNQRAAGLSDGKDAYACYPTCDPKTQPCAASSECIRNPTQPETAGKWVCKPHGSGSAGGACSQPSGTNSTGCGAGLTCVEQIDPNGSGVSSTCLQRCDWFAASPGCASGQRCIQESCVPARSDGQLFDKVAIGDPCKDVNHEGWLCGDDGSTYRGICSDPDFFSHPPKPPTCKARCELGTTCPSGACRYGGGGHGVCP